MKKNFKIVTLLTVFTVMVNVLGVFVMLKPVSALTGATATFDRLTTGETSAATVVVTSDVTNVTEVTGDFTAFGGAADEALAVGSTTVSGLLNPAVGSYQIVVTVVGDTTELIAVTVPVIDSDTVDVSGYITSSMFFDIDTATDNSDCHYDECLAYAGGDPADNYIVDLGELTLGAVNKSGVAAMHVGETSTAVNNYIYFDLSTNAATGAVVTMDAVGTNGTYLNGPGEDAQDIPSVADGATLAAGTAGWGYRWAAAFYDNGNADGSSASYAGTCGHAATTLCAIPASPTTVFSYNGSVEGGRGQIELQAAINGTMIPGTYTNALRFIATSTY
jgi:hypothetical protein